MYWDYQVNFLLQATGVGLFIAYYSLCSMPMRIIGYSLVVNFLVELVAYTFAARGVNNLFIFHGLTIIQFGMQSMFYRTIIQSRRVKKLIVLAIPVFVLFAIFNALYLNPINRYNSYALIFKHFFLTLLILVYFNQILMSSEVELVQFNNYFWISSGLLIASLGNFFIEGLMNYLLAQSLKLATQFYLVGMVLTFLYYAGIIISFLLLRYRRDNQFSIEL
jgi:hypothetical protein